MMPFKNWKECAWKNVNEGKDKGLIKVRIIEMTGLHGSLRYVVYIFMNAAFIFLP